MNSQGLRGGQLLSAGERFASSPGLISRLIAPGFSKMVERVDKGLERGSLMAHLPDGSSRLLGGRAPGFDVELELNDWRALLRLASGGAIGWYQAYEAGEWEADDHAALFALMSANVRTLGNAARSSGPFRWASKLAHWLNRNNRAGSQRNIAAHYDLGNDFYRAWLDESMTYSSAIALSEEPLETAQARKHAAIADRLGDAAHVLEIGCGWGSLADHLAGRGAEVTAISLSDEQLGWAREHYGDPKIAFRKQDYRDVYGKYDAIASVEMVEALGREYWPTFMQCIARSLKPGGRAAIQYISMADDIFDSYASGVDFIQAYIFPGGLLIRSSEFRRLAQANGLSWRDESSFAKGYADTLAAWHERFDRAAEEARLPQGFDERFQRLWKFYLSYCEGGFRAGTIDVHQVTLVKE